MNILVVEDDIELNRSIVDLLTMEQFTVSSAHNLRGAERLICKGFGVALLDIMLPDGDGYRLIQMLRANGSDPRIIMLTALSDGESKRVCYEAGADDYITKPFDMTELLYKISAVKRRVDEPSFCLQIGDLQIDKRTGEMGCGAQCTMLQPSQVRLLESLIVKRRIGESLAIDEIGAPDVDPEMNVRRRVRTLIARTRKAIRDIGSSKVEILSDYGCGYHLEVRR
ncbi:MAG: response regulator transcription factor [Kiritimatiellales bacterium]